MCAAFFIGLKRGDCVALSPKHKAFVAEYLVDLNATQADLKTLKLLGMYTGVFNGKHETGDKVAVVIEV